MALRRSAQARARHDRDRTRSDLRDWQVKRRERTRQLIELGGLVAKAGLVELTGDDRAIIYGGLLAIADRLREDPERATTLWGRRGQRGFGSAARNHSSEEASSKAQSSLATDSGKNDG